MSCQTPDAGCFKGDSVGRNSHNQGHACRFIGYAMQEVEDRDKIEVRVLVATAANCSTMVLGWVPGK